MRWHWRRWEHRWHLALRSLEGHCCFELCDGELASLATQRRGRRWSMVFERAIDREGDSVNRLASAELLRARRRRRRRGRVQRHLHRRGKSARQQKAPAAAAADAARRYVDDRIRPSCSRHCSAPDAVYEIRSELVSDDDVRPDPREVELAPSLGRAHEYVVPCIPIDIACIALAPPRISVMASFSLGLDLVCHGDDFSCRSLNCLPAPLEGHRTCQRRSSSMSAKRVTRIHWICLT